LLVGSHNNHPNHWIAREKRNSQNPEWNLLQLKKNNIYIKKSSTVFCFASRKRRKPPVMWSFSPRRWRCGPQACETENRIKFVKNFVKRLWWCEFFSIKNRTRQNSTYRISLAHKRCFYFFFCSHADKKNRQRNWCLTNWFYINDPMLLVLSFKSHTENLCFDYFKKLFNLLNMISMTVTSKNSVTSVI